MKEVSKVGIFCKGKYLMGVRQDNGKWTEPGGHLHPGEDPLKGAVREVKEETGITLPDGAVKHLGDRQITKPDGTKLLIHTFRSDLKVEPQTTTKKDPDKEVFGWNWIPLKGNGLPSAVNNNLHVPAKHNALHFYLGFEKSAFLRKTLRLSPQTKAFLLDIPGQIAQSAPDEMKDFNREVQSKKQKH